MCHYLQASWENDVAEVVNDPCKEVTLLCLKRDFRILQQSQDLFHSINVIAQWARKYDDVFKKQ